MNKKNIYDKNLRTHGEVSLSAFSYLFSEMVQYSLRNACGQGERVEQQLCEFGFDVGIKILELTSFREKRTKRDIQIIEILSFIHGPVWKMLFGKAADGIEKSETE